MLTRYIIKFQHFRTENKMKEWREGGGGDEEGVYSPHPNPHTHIFCLEGGERLKKLKNKHLRKYYYFYY